MRSQLQYGSGLPALVFGLAMALSGCAGAEKEVVVKFADCPAAVQKTIMDYANGVQFPEVDKETKKDGRVVYEAKGKKADGNKIEIKVAPDGRLVGFKNEEGS
jgi:phage baseplate assembly protein W